MPMVSLMSSMMFSWNSSTGSIFGRAWAGMSARCLQATDQTRGDRRAMCRLRGLEGLAKVLFG